MCFIIFQKEEDAAVDALEEEKAAKPAEEVEKPALQESEKVSKSPRVTWSHDDLEKLTKAWIQISHEGIVHAGTFWQNVMQTFHGYENDACAMLPHVATPFKMALPQRELFVAPSKP